MVVLNPCAMSIKIVTIPWVFPLYTGFPHLSELIQHALDSVEYLNNDQIMLLTFDHHSLEILSHLIWDPDL